MKKKKIISIILTVCIMLASVSMMPDSVYAATATLKVNGAELMTGRGNYVTLDLTNNDRKIAGLQFFVQFDTEAFSVNNVTSLLSDTWELDWKLKTDSRYGTGILCMIQDSALNGITDANQSVIKLNLADKNAQEGKEYSFHVYVIDACDESGNSISTSIATESTNISCVKGPDINISDSINIEGFQISYTLGGLRTISSVEPTINGKEIVEYGNIYAIEKDGVSENDMYIGSKSNYVAEYAATELGTLDVRFSESQTAINYVRTMYENGGTSEALTQEYMIRAYAKLSDGSYVYSNVAKYSIFKVAKVLYDNRQMNTFEGHQYLYNDILKVVDSSYAEKDYNWNNVIIKP